MSAILESALDSTRKAAADAWDAKARAAMVADAKRADLAQEVGRLTADLTILRNQLSVYTGQFDAPSPGHLLAMVKLDDAPVKVEHSYFDGTAKVVSALINGRWINPRDYLADAVVDAWERELSGDAQ